MIPAVVPGENPSNQKNWLIPKTKVLDGGPGKDGIPAVDQPKFKNVNDAIHNYLRDENRVLAYRSGSTIKAYPHPILDWHEIVNDQIGTDQIALTYCPLTGTGIGWGRILNGASTTFGVSGLLFESNLMPYDRLTNSTWSQMFNQCVNGSLATEKPEFFNFVELNFGALKKWFPNAEVLTTETGFNRDYANYPYGNYLVTESTIFPVTTSDSRLHSKEIVRVVIEENQVKAYQYPSKGRKLIFDTVDQKSIVVVGDRENDFLQSYYPFIPDTDTELELELEQRSESNIVFRDQFDNAWDIFGVAVSGPNKGAQLKIPYSYMAYWFSLHSFYPQVELYE